MIAGPHADETLDDIIMNKIKFQEENKYFLWGHGAKDFNYNSANQHIDDDTVFLIHDGTKGKNKTKDTKSVDADFNCCFNERGKWRLPKEAIKGGNRQRFAIVCENLQKFDDEINLKNYFIPNSCDNYSFCETMNFLQNESHRVTVFGKRKDCFSVEDKQKLHCGLEINCRNYIVNSQVYFQMLGRIDYKAKVLEAVECIHLDEKEANKLPLYQPPNMK